MNNYDISITILAGGLSTRMKQNKANLKYKNSTFLEHIYNEMNSKYSVSISHNKNELYENINCNKIIDIYDQIGPLGGIYSSLVESKTDFNFIVSCDTPNITSEFVQFLSTYIHKDYDAIVPVNRQGKKFPTIAFYKKSILPVVEKSISSENYRLMSLLDNINTKFVHLDYSIFQDEMLLNINTYEEYKKFSNIKKQPKILAVSGVKNSGKTTLISKLIPVIKEKGIKIATIKHDGHNFSCDIEGTDTYKHFNSGAVGTAIFSKDKFFIVKNGCVDEKYLKDFFGDVDLIILEGFKKSNYKKIEIVRKGISNNLVCNDDTLIAIVSNCISNYKDIPVFDINDIDLISNLIIRYIND